MHRILFKNAKIVTLAKEEVLKNAFLSVADDKIEKISFSDIDGDFDEVIDCKGRTLLPGLYNTHTHVPMALLRSVGEGLSLSDWLHQKIFPAEDNLSPDIAYQGALLGIAEMIRFGTVSFSDMYFFSDKIAQAAIKAGIKANISRCLTMFDENADPANDTRVEEARALFKNYHNAGNGKIKIDVSVHSDYCSTLPLIRYAREMALLNSQRTHIHLSETIKENDDCKKRYGKSPTQVFFDEGFFDVPGIAAHAVHLSEEDREILASKKIFAVHNPISNLKLASGMANLKSMRDRGIVVSLGTDGPASNNNTDLFEEMKAAALIAKIRDRDPIGISPYEILKLATINGALAQGRENCGMLKEGAKADIIMLDTNALHMLPNNDLFCDIVYSAKGQDVCMTMVDGEILYKDGEFLTLDIERIKEEACLAAKKLLS